MPGWDTVCITIAINLCGSSCISPEIGNQCSDGIDNDQDGFIDNNDYGCLN
jgi:hypothetical protein